MKGLTFDFRVAMLILVLSDEVTERLSILQDDDYILKGIRTIDLSIFCCI